MPLPLLFYKTVLLKAFGEFGILWHEPPSYILSLNLIIVKSTNQNLSFMRAETCFCLVVHYAPQSGAEHFLNTH